MTRISTNQEDRREPEQLRALKARNSEKQTELSEDWDIARTLLPRRPVIKFVLIRVIRGQTLLNPGREIGTTGPVPGIGRFCRTGRQFEQGDSIVLTDP
jgi:hypothetical protein